MASEDEGERRGEEVEGRRRREEGGGVAAKMFSRRALFDKGPEKARGVAVDSVRGRVAVTLNLLQAYF